MQRPSVWASRPTYRGNKAADQCSCCILGTFFKFPADSTVLGSNTAVQLKCKWDNEWEVGNMASKALCDLVAVGRPWSHTGRPINENSHCDISDRKRQQPDLNSHQVDVIVNLKPAATVMQHAESASHVPVQSACHEARQRGKVAWGRQKHPQSQSWDNWYTCEINRKQKQRGSYYIFEKQMSAVGKETRSWWPNVKLEPHQSHSKHIVDHMIKPLRKLYIY